MDEAVNGIIGIGMGFVGCVIVGSVHGHQNLHASQVSADAHPQVTIESHQV